MEAFMVILGVIVAVLVALVEMIELFGEQSSWLKRHKRAVQVVIVLAGILTAAYLLISSDKAADSVDRLEVIIDEPRSRIDSLRDLLASATEDPGRFLHRSKYEFFEFLRSQAKREAEHIDSARLARTVLDSMVVAIGLGDYDEAPALLEEALDDASGDSVEMAEAYFTAGLAHSLNKDYEQAVSMFDSAIAYLHDDHEVWYNRGNALLDLYEYRDAIPSYDSAIVYKRDYYDAWTNQAICLT